MTACNFYLVTPIGLATERLSLDRFGEMLRQALQGPRVEAILLRTAGAAASQDDDSLRRQIDALLPLAHGVGVPLVLEERADLAQSQGCDGVHLLADKALLADDKARVAAVRRALGEDGIVGATCGDSRHSAMEAGEAGADYVSFGNFDPEPQAPDPDLLAWWQEMMEPPCVAMGGITLANARDYAAAGADFMALRQAVWNHDQGPLAAIEAFARTVAEAE